MRLHRKFAAHRQPGTETRHILLLSIFCALGTLLGRIAVRFVSDTAIFQLKAYLDTYIILRRSGADVSSFFIAIVVYFRYALLLFLFSFGSAGTYCVPLLYVLQGFGLAFSLTLFSQCAGGSFRIIFALFGLRCLLILPTTLYCGAAAIVSFGRGRESRGKDFWKRFGLCACVLLFGAILETLIVPNLFAAVYAA